MLKLTITKDSITTVEISEVQGQPLPLPVGTEIYTMKSLEFTDNVETGEHIRDRENVKRQVLLALEGYQRFRAPLPAERAFSLSV